MFRSTLLATAVLGLGALAQSSSSSASSTRPTASGNNTTSSAPEPTLNLFLDSESEQHYVGSIIDANPCETTIALACTAGDQGLAQFSFTCDGQQLAHVTFRGSTEFGFSTSVDTKTAGYDADVKVTESCTLEPSSQAVCSVLISGSIEDHGKPTHTKTTVTYEGAEVTSKWFEVPITGGAEKLPPATATCSGNDNAAPAATGLMDLYKVVIVPGAAALLAGAGAL